METYLDPSLWLSPYLKESYGNLKALIQNGNYEKYSWAVWGDLKITGMLLGQQSGYTNMPYFICDWNNRAKGKHLKVTNCSKENIVNKLKSNGI